MKKILTFILSAVLLLSVIPFNTFTVNAEMGRFGNYTYCISFGKITITGYEYDGSNSAKVIIPSEIAGYSVVGIDHAFSGCRSLESIIIPDSVISIGQSAFEDCRSLESIIIPDGVIKIGMFAFSGCTSLKSITIPDSVMSIGYRAFYGCSSLKSITIPDSVIKIGISAFSDCSSLESITLPDTLTNMSCDFNNCSSLKSITIPDGVVRISDRDFYGCSSLESITIPDSVTSIGDNAFYGCTELKEVHITDMAAWCNIKFDSYFSNPLYYAYNLYLNGRLVTNLVIPAGITNINNYAFCNCSSLKSIIIPDGVVSIGDLRFYNCSSLESVTIPDSVVSIGDLDFTNCSSLKSITITDSVVSIGDFDFSGCSSLESITIPDSVVSIGDNAFSGCSSLKSITIPDGVVSIGDSAFSYCRSLESITIPNGVKIIEDSTFFNCNSLKNIFLPKSLKVVFDDAFSYTYNIKNIYYGGSEEEWNAVTIFPYDDTLKKANVHFNSAGIPGEAPTAPELLKKTACTVTLKHTDGCEYRLNDGEWQSSNVFTGLKPNTEYKFYRRTAAADESPAGGASYALTVVTSDIIKGDINDDRDVNILDLICLKKYFSGQSNIIVPSECLDVSSDGGINSEDLAALRKNLLLQ